MTNKTVLTILLTFWTLFGFSQSSKFKAYADKNLETLQKWYDQETGLWETTSWWNAANAITAIIDYSRITGSDKHTQAAGGTAAGAERRRQ